MLHLPGERDVSPLSYSPSSYIYEIDSIIFFIDRRMEPGKKQ
jgi:hypothetical protein